MLLAPMAARLRERHPRLSVRIREVEVAESFDLLFEGEADLAVVEATPPTRRRPTRFDQRPLLDDPFDLVVPEGHPLAGREGSISPSRPTSRGSPPCRRALPPARDVGVRCRRFHPDVVHHALDWNVVATWSPTGSVSR